MQLVDNMQLVDKKENTAILLMFVKKISLSSNSSDVNMQQF